MKPQVERSMTMIKYKTAHKLTEIVLTNFDSTRTSEIYSINQLFKTVTQKNKRHCNIFEEIMTIVITQTFDSKINQGLTYEYTISGQTFVFLYYDSEESQTIFY